MWPSLPTWGHLHPLVIHFPIALLLTSPLFVLLAICIPTARRSFSASALILLALGTAGALLALSTGNAAENAVAATGELHAILKQHEELGEGTAIEFSVLTGFLGVIVLAPVLFKGLDRPGGT